MATLFRGAAQRGVMPGVLDRAVVGGGLPPELYPAVESKIAGIPVLSKLWGGDVNAAIYRILLRSKKGEEYQKLLDFEEQTGSTISNARTLSLIYANGMDKMTNPEFVVSVKPSAARTIGGMATQTIPDMALRSGLMLARKGKHLGPWGRAVAMLANIPLSAASGIVDPDAANVGILQELLFGEAAGRLGAKGASRLGSRKGAALAKASTPSALIGKAGPRLNDVSLEALADAMGYSKPPPKVVVPTVAKPIGEATRFGTFEREASIKAKKKMTAKAERERLRVINALEEKLKRSKALVPTKNFSDVSFRELPTVEEVAGSLTSKNLPVPSGPRTVAPIPSRPRVEDVARSFTSENLPIPSRPKAVTPFGSVATRRPSVKAKGGTSLTKGLRTMTKTRLFDERILEYLLPPLIAGLGLEVLPRRKKEE